MNKIRDFARKQPARLAAWISATIALAVAIFAPDLPADPIITLALATLGLGEFAQRVEDKKTAAALATDPTTLGE